ncbi:MAG TPA: GAF domain-containing SpoIIE family protein phosphatase [Actinomycetota bacterium]|nr:GAF domain-containing SpoIIE family protein phosphatase [Actinomycetota bacterium]
MQTSPNPRRRRPRPGPLAPWIWNPRWIPGFLLAQVAVLLPFSGRSTGTLEGVPGGLGALLATAAAILCGPIAGCLVALVGGLVYVPLVTDFAPGSQISIFLWLIAAAAAGVIAGRLRLASADRAAAVARERLAANRLHRLQSITETLARATTPEEVAQATVAAALSALGADEGGLTIHSADDPERLQALAGSVLDDLLRAVWRPHPIDTPAPAAEITRTGRPIFIETRQELLARFPLIERIEGDRRFGGFAGVPVALGGTVLGSLGVGFFRDHMVPPEERGLLVSIADQAAIALDRVRAAEEERRARATAEHAEDRLRKLQAVSDTANAAPGLDTLVEKVLPVVRDAVLADGATFLMLSDDRRELRVKGHVGAEEETGQDTVVSMGAGASGRIAATGRPLVIAELTGDDVISHALRERRSYVGVPVRVSGRVVGVLHASSRSAGAFDEDDADFLQSIADSLAATIDRAQLFDQRDRMATALERALLPMSLPHVPGFEIATMYRPSRFGDEVGGDFYDVFGEKDVWYLAIGDVCGKGPEAAAIMGMTRIALRSLAREDDARPLPDVLGLLNGFLIESELMGDRFCTVAVARIELGEDVSTLTTCLGGHPPPLLFRADGTITTVGTPGSLLGLFEDVALHESRAVITRGDVLALFTDGVIELSVDRPDEGASMLRSTLVAAASEDAAAIVKTVERALLDPRGELRDDAALVVAKRLPSAR